MAVIAQPPAAAGGAPPSYVKTQAAPFLASLSIDRRLARFDVAGSIAHVEMLGATGILKNEESIALVGGLRRIHEEITSGTFPWREDLEDVHTNVEIRLTETLGPLGAKVHTARSRNDQIALDERMFLREAIVSIDRQTLALQMALLDLAETHIATPMPGYTHLQRAQPVTLGHHLLAHFSRLSRDYGRLGDAYDRANVSPLGAGALAGSTLPIEPSITARSLGFAAPFENSIDAVSDRDYFAEFLFDLSLLAIHLSSLGEETVQWASAEFGFVRPTSALGSGSSLMPQKRNPDVAELARGKAGRVVGDLVSLLAILKSLPLAYNRDLQEDKAPVFDAFDHILATLDALTTAVSALQPPIRACSPRTSPSTSSRGASRSARPTRPSRPISQSPTAPLMARRCGSSTRDWARTSSRSSMSARRSHAAPRMAGLRPTPSASSSSAHTTRSASNNTRSPSARSASTSSTDSSRGEPHDGVPGVRPRHRKGEPHRGGDLPLPRLRPRTRGHVHRAVPGRRRASRSGRLGGVARSRSDSSIR